MSDPALLCAAAFLRSAAAGGTGVLLAIHAARLGLSGPQAGYVVAAGLAGAAAAAVVVTILGHRVPPRRALVALVALSGVGGIAAALAAGTWSLLVCAFAGMLNGMGRDRGAALILEQGIMPAAVAETRRTQALAWYNVAQDAGHAAGGLLALLPAALRGHAGLDAMAASRVALAACALLALAPVALYPFLSSALAAPASRRRQPLAPESRKILWRISSLFAIDSLAGGFLTTALLSLYFHLRFGVDEGTLGLLFLGARVLNALSHLVAAWLARRIGLVNTMVFTHIPSSVLLATVAWAPSFPVAAALFLLREGLVEMDVPTRQSYVLAVVRPEERVVASGVTHLVRVGAWAVAPSFAGLFLGGVTGGASIVVGASMKIAYDLLLWASFHRLKPPEERGGPFR